MYLAESLSPLSAGTQAVGLCAQRVFNPLPHVMQRAAFPGQGSATPLGAQAGMPVFRALQQARMSPAPLALTRCLQLGSDAAQIVEQNFHIAQRCPVVHDAAAQTEPAAQSRIGKVGIAIPLQCQQQAFIVSVE
jgi:hypothetical protein